ncbi:serine/threonine-protein kinase, partial [Curvibacter fontanus]
EAEDLKQGAWTDLYSLAAVVYSCLRNDPPLPATTRVVRDSMPSVRSVVATVKEHFGLSYSDEFVRTIQHALAVQPADRPQSLAAFVTEMKLKASPRLSKFDWRAELGTSLRTDEEAYNSRQFWHTQPQTVLDPASSARQPRAEQRRRRTGRWLKPAGLGLGLLAGAALLWVWLADGGSLLRDRPVIASPEPVVAPMAATAPAMSGAPASSEPAREAGLVAAGSSPVTSPTAPAPAAAPAAKAPVPPVVSAPVPRPRPAPKVVSREEDRPPAVRAPARPAAAAPPPKAAVLPQEPVVSRDKVLCADANFFTRPICIHNECKKTENLQLPVCIEDRQRYPDERNPTPP